MAGQTIRLPVLGAPTNWEEVEQAFASLRTWAEQLSTVVSMTNPVSTSAVSGLTKDANGNPVAPTVTQNAYTNLIQNDVNFILQAPLNDIVVPAHYVYFVPDHVTIAQGKTITLESDATMAVITGGSDPHVNIVTPAPTPNRAVVLVSNVAGIQADATTWYFGGVIQSGDTQTEGNSYISAPFTGQITAAYVDCIVGTVGSSENVSVSIKNLTTGVSFVLSSTINFGVKASSYAIRQQIMSVTQGDKLEAILTTPTWVTNPIGGNVNVRMVLEY